MRIALMAIMVGVWAEIIFPGVMTTRVEEVADDSLLVAMKVKYRLTLKRRKEEKKCPRVACLLQGVL